VRQDIRFIVALAGYLAIAIVAAAVIFVPATAMPPLLSGVLNVGAMFVGLMALGVGAQIRSARWAWSGAALLAAAVVGSFAR
jgi:hypothetical protein